MSLPSRRVTDVSWVDFDPYGVAAVEPEVAEARICDRLRTQLEAKIAQGAILELVKESNAAVARERGEAPR